MAKTKFRKVPAAEAENLRASGRSNVSAPILRDFIESTDVGDLLEIDPAANDIKAKPTSLYQMLNQHAKNNGVPAKAFMRDSKVFLERLDAPQPKPEPKAEATEVDEAESEDTFSLV